jgi:ubiquinone/menaquinone biosynthesis C-methylase UbiE
MNSVENTYNSIATNFDKTRYKVWRKVVEFLDIQLPNIKVLEVGCGNGKNMLYRNDLRIYGIDISEEQVSICKAKNLNVQKSDMTSLPFNDAEFDAIICIATYHHLQTENERKQALNEMYRVLKSGGKALISVWAMEQDSNTKRKFTQSDEMVSWKYNNSIYYRYYHIYKKDELEEEIRSLCPEFKIESVFYDLGNWFTTISK